MAKKKKHKFVLTYQDEELIIELDGEIITSVFRDDLGSEGLVLAADIVRTIAKILDIKVITE
jgi:lipoate synthase